MFKTNLLENRRFFNESGVKKYMSGVENKVSNSNYVRGKINLANKIDWDLLKNEASNVKSVDLNDSQRKFLNQPTRTGGVAMGPLISSN